MNNIYLEVAIKAAVAAGHVLMECYTEKVQTTNKESSRDIVTEVDKLSENTIIDILKKHDNDISVITEEQGKVHSQSSNKYWIIDALDGTVNYVNHIPFFSVSIGLVINQITQVGVIFAPLTNDIYYGARGVGVFKNNKPIKVKSCSLNEALFAVSFSGKSFDPAKRNDEFKLFGKINDISRGCLRTGSAALNLAYLSEGKFNGCWGKANKQWDIAAGLMLAELAGAKVELTHDKGYFYSYIACPENLLQIVSQKFNSM